VAGSELRLKRGIRWVERWLTGRWPARWKAGCAKSRQHPVTNSWHPHTHALLFLAGDTTDDDVTSRAAAGMYDAWSEKLTRQGFESSDPDHGFDVKVLTLNEGPPQGRVQVIQRSRTCSQPTLRRISPGGMCSWPG